MTESVNHQKDREKIGCTLKLVDMPTGGNTYIGKCEAGDELVYPGITFCLTITAVFENGSRTGVHLVRASGLPDWPVRLEEWITLTHNKIKELGQLPSKVIIAGALDFWKEAYFKGEMVQKEELRGIVERINSDFKERMILFHTMRGNISVDRNGAVVAI